MTNEELMNQVEATARKLRGALSRMDFELDLEKFARSLASSAYEEAGRAVCENCRALQKPSALVDGKWIHLDMGGRLVAPCDAHAIHELKPRSAYESAVRELEPVIYFQG